LPEGTTAEQLLEAILKSAATGKLPVESGGAKP
jgi:hypothetical protein